MVGRVQLTRREISDGRLQPPPAAGQLTRWSERESPSLSDLQEVATGVGGGICLGNDRIDAALVDAAPPSPLKVVSLASTRSDAVGQQAAPDRGAAVTHTPGVLTETAGGSR